MLIIDALKGPAATRFCSLGVLFNQGFIVFPENVALAERLAILDAFVPVMSFQHCCPSFGDCLDELERCWSRCISVLG